MTAMTDGTRRVLVIGANGSTGSRVVRLLAGRAEYAPVAMVRDAAQSPRFEEMGVETAVADLEGLVDPALEGCDAVIFCAGSGAGTGLDKTVTVDRDGAVKSMVAAEAQGVERYVMLSSRGADPESEGDRLSPYYRAKGHADVWLRRSDLIHTIVRPGRLTDEEGTGRLELAPSLPSGGSIPRDDVARVLVECLGAGSARGRTFAIVSGPTPIEEALAAV